MILPVRACISRNDKSIKSKTGLSKNAKDFFIRPGKGNSFAKDLNVKADEVYFLIVDNVYGSNSGYKIRFNFRNENSGSEYAAGESLIFENICFHEGTANFLPSSMGWLDSLRRIMIHNPKLKIEIQGHVDGYSRKLDSLYNDMSEKRARAVYDYLVANHINPNRMSYVGYGNTKMKYKYPDFNLQHHLMNRRVEIKIVSN